MFRDNVALVYDVFANVINKKSKQDAVHSGSGADLAIRRCAGMCLRYGASDRCDRTALQTPDRHRFSAKMLKRAEKKYGKYSNVRFEQANILRLSYPDGCFDTVIAANVIHLLDEPHQALHELERVCKPGGKIIIPTYMNQTDKGNTNGVSGAIGRAGADFKREFTLDTYKQFFADAGYMDAGYVLCKGIIPCAVAILTKSKKDRTL